MTTINSMATFQAWDGTGTATITSDFTITANDASPPAITGTLNGGNYTITITLATVGTTFSGLCTLSGGTIQHLAISVTQGTLITLKGWLCGTSTSGTITYVKMTVGTSNITQNTGCGGLCGSAASTLTISKCYFTGPVGYEGGGFIGLSTGTVTISDSYTSVTSFSNGSGGFVGANSSNVTINTSISKGTGGLTTSSQSGSGGFFGSGTKIASINNCYSLIDITSTGAGGTAVNVGGFFGNHANTAGAKTISNSYYLGTISNGTSRTSGTVAGGSTATALITYSNFAGNNAIYVAKNAADTTGTASGTNISNYTSATANTTEPINSFSATFWDKSVTPPILITMKSAPYSGYSRYNSTVTFTPCFLKGTKLRTLSGYELVENLKEGDKLVTTNFVTKEKGETTITKISAHTTIGHDKNLPYKIVKNKCGESKPFEDLYMSRGHAYYTANQTPVHVHHSNKRNWEYVGKEVTYYYVETTDFENDIIFANGLEVESCAPNKEYKRICDPLHENCVLTKKSPEEIANIPFYF